VTVATAVRRTAGLLADGREIVWFDDTEPWRSGARTRDTVDRRVLGAAAPAGERRLDPLTGDWVAVAAHRMDRTFLPPADQCPLCPTRPGTAPSEVPSEDYDVVAFENRFPSFSHRGADAGSDDVEAEPLLARAPATGRTEVVCFTSRHDGSFADLPVSRVRTVVEAWADRTRELSAVDGVEQVFCFENRGTEIGVTLTHPHGQVYAYPYVTPRTARLLQRAAEHRARTGGDLMGDVLAAEQRSGRRVLLEGGHWTAYVPAAARWPVEVHLTPTRSVADLAALSRPERDELADVWLDVVRRLDRFHAGDGEPVPLPYVAAWHAAPVRRGRDLVRLQLQVTSVLRAPGRLKYLAASESAMGAFINDTTPERIADVLRAVAP
jgi:UDPglucose--hexose-1-phosphate uridylyltransferase